MCPYCALSTHYKIHNIATRSRMSVTVPPGDHYKVRTPPLQAAKNTALAGDSTPCQTPRRKAPYNALHCHPCRGAKHRSIDIIVLCEAV